MFCSQEEVHVLYVTMALLICVSVRRKTQRYCTSSSNLHLKVMEREKSFLHILVSPAFYLLCQECLYNLLPKLKTNSKRGENYTRC